MATTDENTPLLANGGQQDSSAEKKQWRITSPESRILFAAFFITTAFTITQTPLIYALRLMECDAFYADHPPFEGNGDRCHRPEVDAATSIQLAIIGMTSLLSSVLNLFATGWMIRKYGPRFALVANVFVPVFRVSVQIIGIWSGGRTGVILIQLSQILCLVGGPAGYILALNTAVAEVVEPSARTVAFGVLQGSTLLGSSLGYLLGGIIGDNFDIDRPFEVTAVMLAVSCVYAVTIIPYIDPSKTGGETIQSTASEKKPKSFFGVFGILAPRRLRLESGKIVKHYGIMWLAIGIFTAVLALTFAPIALQLYAMTVFEFSPSANSTLMSVSALLRGVFLICVFPNIISYGRKWYAPSKDVKLPESDPNEAIPTNAATDFGPTPGVPSEQQEPAIPPPPAERDTGAAFDLLFLRISIVVDALITGCIAFATQDWHVYLAAYTLPLASGTAPASKGVLTDMVRAEERAAALQAMTTVEYIATLIAMGAFGGVFAAFSNMGKAYLTFYCNTIIALLAVAILFLAKLPPQNSSIEADDTAASSASEEPTEGLISDVE